MRRVVIANLQIEGLHFWPECPLFEVKYLADMHRHMFHIKAVKEVTHNDRDVEFIVLKNQIKGYLEERFKGKFDRMSCEDIAELLIEKFDLCECEVLEDGENGARLTV